MRVAVLAATSPTPDSVGRTWAVGQRLVLGIGDRLGGQAGESERHADVAVTPRLASTRATPEARETPCVVVRALHPFLLVTPDEAPGLVA